MKMPVRDWYLQILKIFALIGSTYGIAWIILGVINDHSLISLALAYTGASAVFLVAAYFLIGDELRGMLLRFFNHSKTSLRFVEEPSNE